MKKWNNPELLNLMLQETKNIEEQGILDEIMKHVGHECKKTGHACASDLSGKTETCIDIINKPHDNFQYQYRYLLGFNDLISCCSDDSTVGPS